MLNRRSFLASLLAGLGTTAAPALASPPGTVDLLLQLYDRIPGDYLQTLSAQDHARIIGQVTYGVKRSRFLRKHIVNPRKEPLYQQEPAERLRGRRLIESPYAIYYGDPHGHSAHSDGMRSAKAYYTYAENIGLDFAVLTDHAEILSPAEWRLNCQATEERYIPGQFVTLQAYEHTNCVDGNYDIYMLTDHGEEPPYGLLYAWFNFFVWRPNEYTNENFVERPDMLFDRLKLLKHDGVLQDVMAVPHHCSWSLAPTNWKYFDPELIYFAEGYSKHGNSLLPVWFEDCFDIIPQYLDGCSVLDALTAGKRLGITAATDTHGGRPGSIHTAMHRLPMFCYTGGLTGVLVDRDRLFDRAALWDAMKKRRIFGTRVYGLQMSFRVGENEMGSVIQADGPPQFTVEVHSPDIGDVPDMSSMISYVEIIKNGSIVFKDWNLGDRFRAACTWSDPFFNDSIDNTYFLRVVGYMGDLAWSSPIFIEKTSL